MSIFNWFRRKPRQPNRFGCTHPPQRREFTIKVLGIECTFKSADGCISCFERYANEMSTLCAHCEKPIFPGESVGAAWIGAKHPYTHNTFKCGEPGFWVGTWGEGKLVPITATQELVSKGSTTIIRPKHAA